MPDIVLKGVPEEVHRKLKQLSAQSRRSMNRQAILILERAVTEAARGPDLPPPLKGKFPITDAFLNRAKRQGRP